MTPTIFPEENLDSVLGLENENYKLFTCLAIKTSGIGTIACYHGCILGNKLLGVFGTVILICKLFPSRSSSMPFLTDSGCLILSLKVCKINGVG